MFAMGEVHIYLPSQKKAPKSKICKKQISLKPPTCHRAPGNKRARTLELFLDSTLGIHTMTNEPLEFEIPIYLRRTEALDLGVKNKGIIRTKKPDDLKDK